MGMGVEDPSGVRIMIGELTKKADQETKDNMISRSEWRRMWAEGITTDNNDYSGKLLWLEDLMTKAEENRVAKQEEEESALL
eukprot:m.77251 g.77251  ORF g.77251 m.77251 type:complete len:82 (-) comp24994_c0_seq1:41-286(-)